MIYPVGHHRHWQMMEKHTNNENIYVNKELQIYKMSSRSSSSKSPAGSARTVLTMKDLQAPQVSRSRSRSKSAKSKNAAVTKACVAEAKKELVAQLLEEELPMEAPTLSLPVRAPSPVAPRSASRKSAPAPAPAPSRSASRSSYMSSHGTVQKVLEDEQAEASVGRSAARSADRAASRASAIARNASPTDVDFAQEEEKVRRLSMKSAMKSNRAMSAEARVAADAEMEASGNVAKTLVERVMSVLTLTPMAPASSPSMSPPRRSKSKSATYSIPSVVTPPAYRPIR